LWGRVSFSSSRSESLCCFELDGEGKKTKEIDFVKQRRGVPVQEHRLESCLDRRNIKVRTPLSNACFLTCPSNLVDAQMLSRTFAVEYGQFRYLEPIAVLHEQAFFVDGPAWSATMAEGNEQSTIAAATSTRNSKMV
jgi:hypothetical protein